mgnify:FL=1|tara:strand:+ start:800 stop:2356 length:1557 start_codon:yes stop_codon:yes gene_type:complete
MKFERSNKNSWVIGKHISNVDLMYKYAKFIKNNSSPLTKESLNEIGEIFKSRGVYSPRWIDRQLNTSTVKNKITTLNYWMFGYNHDEKFLFSPLGNLFLKHYKNLNSQKYIFTTMLWSMQFPHPQQKSNQNNISIYPFRLMLKLLTEQRLNKKLYPEEILYFLFFVRGINQDGYHSLIEEILNFRKLSNSDKKQKMLSENLYSQTNYEKWSKFPGDSVALALAKTTWWANKTHELNYYARKIFETTEIIYGADDKSSRIIFRQGKSEPPTLRKIQGYFKLNHKLIDFVKELDDSYSFLENPIKKTEGLLDSEFKSTVYGFYPKILLDKLNIKKDNVEYKIARIKEIIPLQNIEEISLAMTDASIDGAKHKEFEIAIADAFNLFKDVKAERVGGAGETDVKCKNTLKDETFAIEAKSTKSQLSELSNETLKEHREKFGAKYTILMTPRYAPKVRRHISKDMITILKPAYLSEYLSNYYRNSSDETSFKELNELIKNNMGKDISEKLNKITINKFGNTAL